MNHSKKITIILVFSVIGLIFAGAYLVSGHPSQTNECNQCHAIDPVLMTITSNATGSIDAKVGKQFSLVINAASLATDATVGSVAVKVYSGWADNSQFSFTDQAVSDNQVNDTNANTAQITTTFTFTPLTVGTWDLRIWAAAGKTSTVNRISQKLDVTVVVTSSDTVPPNIDSPSDMIISEGDATKNITWNPSDANPNSYEVFDNGLSWLSGLWSGSSITIPLNTLALGNHNVTLAVWDIAANTASDQVDVTVLDGTAPVIDSPADNVINEGTTGNSITWNPTDSHPLSYIIYRDGQAIKSGAWNNTFESISVSVDSLSLGTYNYTILVGDVGSNKASDTVWINVIDGTAPTVDNPADINYPVGDTGHFIIWTPSDLHPASYQVFLDGFGIKSNTWNSSSETIGVSVDELSIGTYNYTIVVTDIGGNTAIDEVSVTVFSTDLPTIDHPADKTIAEGIAGSEIVWNPLDLNPSTYAVYRNTTLVKSGLWNSSADLVSISLDGLALGVYNCTVIVTDQDNNTAVDTVWVSVIDATPPTIDSPLDIIYDEGSLGGSILWNPSDLHPISYSIYLNEIQFRAGLWNSSSEAISVSVDGHVVGDFNYTLVVIDIAGNIGTDTVFVYVLDATPPTIDNPSDISYDEGDLGGVISWNPFDLHPAIYDIYRNGIMVKSGQWNSSSELVVISVAGLSFGSYNFTVAVFDIGGNSVSDLVLVNVTDGTPPVLNSPADISYIEGNIGNSIIWDPSDLHPGSYEVFRNGVIFKSGQWNSSSESILVSIDGLAQGTYNYSIRVVDAGNNSATDEVDVIVQAPASTTTTTTLPPTQTSPTGNPNNPQIPLGSIMTVVLTWIVAGTLAFVAADFLIRKYRG